MFSTPRSAAKLSLMVVTSLVVLKAAVAVVTGSISILAQAIDSFLDLFAVGITFFAVVISSKPADEEHPFGHGKVENIAAVVQAVLIFAAGGFVIYSAIQRMVAGTAVERTEAGIGVMLVSIIVSLVLSRYMLRVSRANDSIAVEANARNIAADVYSAGAVLAGLLAVRLTGLNILDPIIALGVALLILKAAYDVLCRSFGGLIDVRLPDIEESIITESIMSCDGEVVGFHRLRTRKVGSQRQVDLHLVMPRDVSVEEAHRVCDRVERDIELRLSEINVVIHVEPCNEECDQCPIYCHYRGERSG